MIDIPELCTPRLILRGHRAGDHAEAVRLWQSPAVYEAIGGEPLSEQEVWLRILRYSGLWDFLGFGYWAVLERESGAYIGQLGFADFRRGLVGFDGHYPEAGWAINPYFAGRGYATEGVTAACRWLDSRTAHKRSFCLIDGTNKSSQRIAEKMGFRYAIDTAFGASTTGVYFRERGAFLG